MPEPTAAELSDRRAAAHPAAGHQGHNTTPAAWLTVGAIIVAFTVGGIALIIWNFLMFWIAVAVAVVAAGIAGAIGIMDQVTEYHTGGTGGDTHTELPGARSSRAG